jgi:predicted kinase
MTKQLSMKQSDRLDSVLAAEQRIRDIDAAIRVATETLVAEKIVLKAAISEIEDTIPETQEDAWMDAEVERNRLTQAACWTAGDEVWVDYQDTAKASWTKFWQVCERCGKINRADTPEQRC